MSQNHNSQDEQMNARVEHRKPEQIGHIQLQNWAFDWWNKCLPKNFLVILRGEGLSSMFCANENQTIARMRDIKIQSSDEYTALLLGRRAVASNGIMSGSVSQLSLRHSTITSRIITLLFSHFHCIVLLKWKPEAAMHSLCYMDQLLSGPRTKSLSA